jgi:alpha-tubulin suppressor-like RCC1 family protein
VAALGNGVAQVTAGGSYTCARKLDGTVYCWGKNSSGQLGTGTTVGSPTPVLVEALGTDAVEVAAGGMQTCARRRDGTLWCWGFGNFADGLGWKGHLVPTRLAALGSDVAGIAVGQSHYCARKTDGTLWCWGWNAGGQLGDGTLVDQSTPIEVTTLGRQVSDVSTGSQATCARKSDGTLWCWGWRNGGSTPTQVASLGADVSEVSAGGSHICARKSDGGLWCWGVNNNGQLGDGSARYRDTPVMVAATTRFRQVASGFTSTCAIDGNGRSSCWGDGSFGKLGNGSFSVQAEPLAQASLGIDVSQLASGNGSFCARKTDGSAWCWGNNLAGRTDEGPTPYRPSPVEVVALGHSVVQIAGGWGDTTCALRTNDLGVWCWGSISTAAGGVETRPIPFQVAGLPTGIGEVVVGWGHACARADDGRLWCWGRNDNGELGDGSDAFFQERPVQVGALGAEVAQVATSGTHTCARKLDGTLWCWGSNDAGQLGDGTTAGGATPRMVQSLGASVRQVSTGSNNHTCARLADGTAWCWGDNYAGQLGDGTTSSSALPVQVLGLASVVDISAGFNHACARESDGTLWCWGDNKGGQLGDGRSGQLALATSPVRVAKLGTDVVEVRAGIGAATCARRKGGDVWCWGARGCGMMGDGDIGFALSPVRPAGCR